MVKTAPEEAWEENFKREISRIGKEIIVQLNENFARNKQLLVDQDFGYGAEWFSAKLIVYDSKGLFEPDLKKDSEKYKRWGTAMEVFSFSLQPNLYITKPGTKKFFNKYKWYIWLRFWVNKEEKKHLFIPVSKGDTFTRDEIQKAKNSIFVKVLDFAKKFKADLRE